MLGRRTGKCKKGVWTTARKTFVLEFVEGERKTLEDLLTRVREADPPLVIVDCPV
jgi:hypothetical protein